METWTFFELIFWLYFRRLAIGHTKIWHVYILDPSIRHSNSIERLSRSLL